MDQLKEKWNEILLAIKEENDIQKVSFKTWLEPLEVYDIEGDTLIILFPSEPNPLSINLIQKNWTI